VLLACAFAARVRGGGSGLNVVVVANQASTNSVQLANYYCELRQVPPQNVLWINWTGTSPLWAVSDFTANLANPLTAMLASRQLATQIDYVVLSMDIPFSVTSPDSFAVNSTTSALFYGFKPDTNPPCSLALGSASLYTGSESPFRSAPPLGAGSNAFLVTMITSSNLALAKQIVSQGVLGDGTFPTQTVFLVKNPYDEARNVRFTLFDNAIFNARLRGAPAMQRIVASTPNGLGPTFGYQAGVVDFTLSGVSAVPGAIADNLTSYGGLINGTGGQYDMLGFLAAGAAGTYGTVSEPCNYLEKFPNPLDYFYLARGFNLAESYYQSVTNPYQGLMVAEPLSAPFARPPGGAWTSPPSNAVLHGLTNLTLQITAADTNHPVSQVDLFVDGTFLRTLTNLPPQSGNMLSVTVGGRTASLTVPPGAALGALASNLAVAINAPAVGGAAAVSATAIGDRVELHGTAVATSGSQIGLSTSVAAGPAGAQTTFLQTSGTTFLDTIASGFRAFTVQNTPAVGDYLQLVVGKVSGQSVTNSVTNTVSGTSLSTLVNNLVGLVNADLRLQDSDGLTAIDWFNGDIYGEPTVSGFNVEANSPGWAAAQISTTLSSSTNLVATPGDLQALVDNLGDLQPRAHLYVTAGATRFPLTFALDTTSLADGFHELTAVVYEGSNVRTQTRVVLPVVVQNTSLSATLSTPFPGTNVAGEATVPFSVAVNTNLGGVIQLFSTGGLLAAATNQASVSFPVAGASLGLGLHPVYAVVTQTGGAAYRTATKWIRFVGPDAPFSISLAGGHPPTLVWPATSGRNYQVLATTNAAASFQATATVTPTNSPAAWADTNSPAVRRFYQVVTPN